MPHDLSVIDTMIGLPSVDRQEWQQTMAGVLRDKGSRGFTHPAGYMFKHTPEQHRDADSIDRLLFEMDRFGIERGLVPVNLDDELHVRALRDHPDRLLGSIEVDPNRGVAAVAGLKRAVTEHGVVAAQFFPAGKNPPVAIDDPLAYVVYGACVELDIPVFVQGGVPGPRVPMASQYPGLVDRVCYDFPELRFVFRHGCEPWVDLTVKLLLKWPNLYYSTTAFAPRYYPQAILDYVNTRGADKIIYGGYYPWGFELERIFDELDGLDLRDDVWPRFLHDNAARVLGLDS
ncbi:MAG: amidohydrolase [Acidimicrobiales bacterium]|nr:amidohydrolase [Acidimicrobiales bacterium]